MTLGVCERYRLTSVSHAKQVVPKKQPDKLRQAMKGSTVHGRPTIKSNNIRQYVM